MMIEREEREVTNIDITQVQSCDEELLQRSSWSLAGVRCDSEVNLQPPELLAD